MEHKNFFKGLKALYINCTLKKSPDKSHTAGLMSLSEAIMKREGVELEHIRFIDYVIASGIHPDMTEHGWEKDEWPAVYNKILDADILILGTPIWLGEKSSEATKLIERLYAMSGEKNDKGQSIFYGKVGGCIITGNEDGVKHCAMSLIYALQHIGYSIPPQADAGWIGEIGPGPSYLDEEANAKANEFTNKNTTFMTYNIMHLAKQLKENHGYASYGNNRDKWEDGKRWALDNPEYR